MGETDGESASLFDRLPLIRDALLIGLLLLLLWKLGGAELSLDLGTFRFGDLLSLILALFTIGLASAFYFKTTETSNRFYDRTFRFTKDISEVLGRIEERFGERLRHVEEGFGGLREEVAQLDLAEAQEQIAEEEQEAEQLKRERDELLEELAERADLHEEERDEYLGRIQNLEQEVNRARTEIGSLQRRMFSSERDSNGGLSPWSTKPSNTASVLRRVRRSLKKSVVPRMSDDGLEDLSGSEINERFQQIKDFLPGRLLADMQHLDFLGPKGELTSRGALWLMRISRDVSS